MSAHTEHSDRFVTVRGLRFHYCEWGDTAAPAAVFLHGITSDARAWDDEARALAARFRVVALDLRGHGDSEKAPDGDYSHQTLADDFAAVADAIGLARFHLVGLSLGGRVGFAYAAAHPGRVERLVVVDIGPDIAADGILRVLRAMASAPERFATLDDVRAWIRAMNPRYTETKLRQRAELAVRPLPDGGCGWKYDVELRESVRQGRMRPAPDLWPAWTALACPTLLIQGAESDLLTDEIAKRMIEAQPHARLAVVPGAGHTVPGDQPAAFLRLLTEFLTAP